MRLPFTEESLAAFLSKGSLRPFSLSFFLFSGQLRAARRFYRLDNGCTDTERRTRSRSFEALFFFPFFCCFLGCIAEARKYYQLACYSFVGKSRGDFLECEVRRRRVNFSSGNLSVCRPREYGINLNDCSFDRFLSLEYRGNCRS